MSYGTAMPGMENRPSTAVVTEGLPGTRTVAPAIGSPWRSFATPATVIPGFGPVPPLSVPPQAVKRPRPAQASATNLCSLFMDFSPRRSVALTRRLDASVRRTAPRQLLHEWGPNGRSIHWTSVPASPARRRARRALAPVGPRVSDVAGTRCRRLFSRRRAPQLNAHPAASSVRNRAISRTQLAEKLLEGESRRRTSRWRNQSTGEMAYDGDEPGDVHYVVIVLGV